MCSDHTFFFSLGKCKIIFMLSLPVFSNYKHNSAILLMVFKCFAEDYGSFVVYFPERNKNHSHFNFCSWCLTVKPHMTISTALFPKKSVKSVVIALNVHCLTVISAVFEHI